MTKAHDTQAAMDQTQNQAQHLNTAPEERLAHLQDAADNMPKEVESQPTPQNEEAWPEQPEEPGENAKYRRRTKSGKRTLMAFVEDIYLPHMRLRKRSWTVDARLASRFIYPTFGNREIRNIRAIEVERWLDRLTNKLAPSSCNRVLAVFKTIEAVRLMTILEQSERQEAQALRLLLLTGARKSEILKARWENVHLDLHMISVPISKSGKTRYIFLSDAARDILAGLKSRGKSPWLFPGRSSRKPISDIFAYWKEVRDELNLADVRIHDLRHTFASFLVNAGHTLYEAQKMLGHADPRTTMRYAHLGQDALVTAAETVSKLLESGTQAQTQSPTEALA